MKKILNLPETVYDEIEKTVKRMLDRDEADPRVIDSTRVNRLAEEQKDKGEFFANFYSLLVFNIADRTTLDEAKAWVEFVEELAAEQAKGQEKPEEFLGNFYSLIVEFIAMSESMDKELIDSWMDFVEESVEKRSKNQKDPEEFMQNFYNMVLTKLVEIRKIRFSSEFITENFIEDETPEDE
ncbi:MAG: hypothetical protein ACFFBS_05615 [Promethearchaeota archaeon]